jgi:hypothetical protein
MTVKSITVAFQLYSNFDCTMAIMRHGAFLPIRISTCCLMRQPDRSDQWHVPHHDARRVLRFLEQGPELNSDFCFNKFTLRIKS